MMFSTRVTEMRAPPIYELVELAKRYDNSIYFNVGDPDFDTPAFIKEAAIEAIKNGLTHYTGSVGLKMLRERIAEYESEYLGSDIKVSNVIITNGGTTALSNALLTFVNPGEEVIVLDPWWPGHPRCVVLANAKMVTLPLDKDENFRINLDTLNERITDNTKAIIIVNPNNPTGVVFSDKELKGILELAEENNIVVIADEVYDKIVYENSFTSLGRLASDLSNIVIVRSFSKNYAMTGWRIGYIVTDSENIKGIQKINAALSLSQVSISQFAALAIFENPELADKYVRYMVEEYKNRRDIVVNGLKKAGIFNFVIPKGTFYIFPWLKGIDMSSLEFVKWLISEAHVLVAPGYMYFGYTGEGHIRISYSVETEKVKEGIERIVEAVHNKLL